MKPAKKKSLWSIGLIIAGAVTLTIVIAVVAYVYTVDTVTYAADRGGLTTGGAARINRHDIGGMTLLRFCSASAQLPLPIARDSTTTDGYDPVAARLRAAARLPPAAPTRVSRPTRLTALTPSRKPAPTATPRVR